MINDQPASEELDQLVALLHSVNSVAIDLADYIAQWTREQWLSAFEVRRAIRAASQAAPGISDYLLPTSHVPEWLRETLNQTWFVHPGSHPAPSWLTSIDYRIDWFALADEHPALVLDNPCTELVTPSMMRDAVTLARTRDAQVLVKADLRPSRGLRTIICELTAIYISSDHDPSLLVDITDIFGGITPEPASGPRAIPALNTATDPYTVYFGWEWFKMSWPDNPEVPPHGYAS